MDPDRIRRLARLLSCAGELSALLRKSPQAPDLLTSEFLRRKKNFTASDRRLVSEAAFTALRLASLAEDVRRLLFETPETAAGNGMSTSALTVWCALAAAQELGIRPLSAALQSESGEGSAVAIADAIAGILAPGAPDSGRTERSFAAVRVMFEAVDAAVEAPGCRGVEASVFAAVARGSCMPDWLLEALASGAEPPRGVRGAVRVSRALWSGATVGLRVNRTRMARDEVLAILLQRGFPVRASTFSPFGIVLEQRVSLTGEAVYADGAVEIQDIGSQLIACALTPGRGQRILDACAGAGGKTLHIADLQRDSGAVLAADIEPRRLRALLSRARRCGFTSIDTVHARTLLEADGTHAPDLRGLFDAVLVDAPCSGLGTARRNPVIKWRLSEKTVARIALKQRRILQDYAAFVKPGGTLVYATCSLLPQENEDVARDFLATNTDFSPSPLSPAFAAYGIEVPDLSENAYHLTLSPDLHGTDGFFIARMKRREM